MPSLSLQSKLKLPSGYEIPQLGFGVYQTPPEETAKIVTHALKTGYRHIDSAVNYRNESGCGEALRAPGAPPRDQVFFTTKIPRNSNYESAKAQVDKSLREAGVDYFDLILIHAPYGGPEARKGVWLALVEAVEAGKVRSIGISNYGVHHLAELEEYIAQLEKERGGKGKGGVVSVGQWEIHPWCQRKDIVEWCQKRGVAIEAYSPLVRGQRFGEPSLKALASKHGKSEAQVLIRWSLQKGYVPLPKSAKPERVEANADVFDFELSEEDIKSLDTDEYAPVCWDPVISKLED
ncbi:hypothetical protein VTK73DRAFT_6669 [Phialemonium thermophilum]|uniref:NADP-dependent oxidoreductase domain-containing protein n=1 Tax=Phialemonium thermophilum TaxID=223376 RepID=A0ABR3WIK0_9PEZI